MWDRRDRSCIEPPPSPTLLLSVYEKRPLSLALFLSPSAHRYDRCLPTEPRHNQPSAKQLSSYIQTAILHKAARQQDSLSPAAEADEVTVMHDYRHSPTGKTNSYTQIYSHKRNAKGTFVHMDIQTNAILHICIHEHRYSH